MYLLRQFLGIISHLVDETENWRSWGLWRVGSSRGGKVRSTRSSQLDPSRRTSYCPGHEHQFLPAGEPHMWSEFCRRKATGVTPDMSEFQSES